MRGSRRRPRSSTSVGRGGGRRASDPWRSPSTAFVSVGAADVVAAERRRPGRGLRDQRPARRDHRRGQARQRRPGRRPLAADGPRTSSSGTSAPQRRRGRARPRKCEARANSSSATQARELVQCARPARAHPVPAARGPIGELTSAAAELTSAARRSLACALNGGRKPHAAH